MRVTREQLQKERDKRKTEVEVEREIRAFLKERRIVFSKTDAALSYNANLKRVQRARAGWPDYVACVDGRFVAIELKRAVGGRLSRDQALMLQKIHQAGGVVCIARSVADLREALASGTRKTDLDEIEKTIAKPVKSGLESKPFNEFGF